MDNTPIQYLQGYVEFYKLKFKVTSDVLIPRPETELLVDAVIKFSKQPFSCLDLGTGAGAIAISIAKNLPNCKIYASEVSLKALKVAKQNAKLHQVEDSINFLKSDLLSNFDTPVDVIVTNLPYIPSHRIPYLDSSVKDYEPHLALDGGSDGFKLYRKLFNQINQKGWKPKLLVGEIDYTHKELAYDEAYSHFKGAQIEVKTDLAHLQRILVIKFAI